MKRLALAVLMEEAPKEITAYVHSADGIDRYVAALQRVSLDISDQFAAFNDGRMRPRDPEVWRSKAGRLKERIDRALPDLKALQAEFNRQANGGDPARRLRELVQAIEVHRRARQQSSDSPDFVNADLVLWQNLDRVTGNVPMVGGAAPAATQAG